MVDEVSAAITWVQQNAKRFGGSPGRISLLGHSAGAHLCLMALLLRACSRQKHSQTQDQTQNQNHNENQNQNQITNQNQNLVASHEASIPAAFLGVSSVSYLIYPIHYSLPFDKLIHCQCTYNLLKEAIECSICLKWSTALQWLCSVSKTKIVVIVAIWQWGLNLS